jgi:hypothetical protein
LKVNRRSHPKPTERVPPKLWFSTVGEVTGGKPSIEDDALTIKWRPPPKSGYYGVYKEGSAWRAKIQSNGTKSDLGLYDTKEEAAYQYDVAARQRSLSGEGGRVCNFKDLEAGLMCMSAAFESSGV